MLQKIKLFLPFFIAITGILAIIYGISHQNLRQEANDPQINISEDIAFSLTDTPQPRMTGHINIAKSLYPFYIIYDNNGKIIESSALLNGEVPQLPEGVLDYTRSHGQDRITWQPSPGVRIAAIITRFESSTSAGFVLAGRNLREIEKREEMLTFEMFFAWLFINIATFLAVLLFFPIRNKK